METKLNPVRDVLLLMMSEYMGKPMTKSEAVDQLLIKYPNLTLDGKASEDDFPTVRDQFAMAALTGLLANPNVIGYSSACGWAPINCKLSDIAETAMHGVAVAMMQARKEAP